MTNIFIVTLGLNGMLTPEETEFFACLHNKMKTRDKNIESIP